MYYSLKHICKITLSRNISIIVNVFTCITKSHDGTILINYLETSVGDGCGKPFPCNIVHFD